MKPQNFLFLCFILAMQSCVSTAHIENEWSAPDQKIDSTKMFQKILFVALLKDNPTRRIAEDKLVAEVRPRGVASYSYLGAVNTTPNEGLIADRLRQDGFDGVVVMRLAEADKNKNYVPGSYPSYYSSWYGYYSTTYPRYNDPNYYSSATVYNIETNVYSLKDNKLLWTGITTAPNLSDKKAMMDRVIAMIKQKMKSQGVLK